MGKALFLLVGGDLLLTLMAQTVGVFAQSTLFASGVSSSLPFGLRWLVFALVLLLTTYLVELYSMDRHFGRKSLFLRVLAALSLALLVLLVLYRIVPELGVDRRLATLTLVAFGIFQFAWHECYPVFLHVRGVAKKILILGVGPLAAQIGRSLSESNHSYVLAGYVQPGGEIAAVPDGQILGSADGLFATARDRHIDKIVISMTEKRGTLPVGELLQCRFNGIEVIDAMTFHENATGKLLVDQTRPDWFIYCHGFRLTGFKRATKRLFDLVAASCGLILAAPLFPIIALAIRLDSRGPVFFQQRRVGEHDRTFAIYKFRTMADKAEQDSGAVWATVNDARVTAVGRFLRKSRLDELPQLVNIIKGDMSLVGPRPERPEFVRLLQEQVPHYCRRHAVRPGLTGWAQVRFPYGASVEDALEKLKYDLYYVKHFTPMLDLLILLETVKVVLFGRGGR